MSEEPDRRPTQRFSDRVAYYVRYRPGYPPGLLPLLRRELDLTPSDVIADVGSGTGKLSELLLDAGHIVHAVEPNAEMRAAARERLGQRPGFHDVAGSAEASGLPDSGVDLVVAAQAFHWFRANDARREFRRILRPEGAIVLVWNRRREAGPFLEAYERLLQRRGIDYQEVDHRTTTDCGALDAFFGRSDFPRTILPHQQRLDWEGLRGRALSSSYVPLAGQPGHDELMRELRTIYDGHQRHGQVRLEYDTEVFWSRLSDTLPGGTPR